MDSASGSRHSTVRRRALALGVVGGALVIAASWGRLHAWMVAYLPVAEAIIRTRPVVGVTVFVLFAAFSAMAAFVSSAVIVPVGVYVWGRAVSAMLLLIGWVLGGVATYAISRYLGRPAVNAISSSPLIATYEERLSRSASFGVVLLFQLAMPSEVPGYVLGLVRYHFWKYLAALTLAELPYAVTTVFLGASFVERRITVLLIAGAVMVTFSLVALHLLHRRFRSGPATRSVRGRIIH